MSSKNKEHSESAERPILDFFLKNLSSSQAEFYRTKARELGTLEVIREIVNLEEYQNQKKEILAHAMSLLSYIDFLNPPTAKELIESYAVGHSDIVYHQIYHDLWAALLNFINLETGQSPITNLDMQKPMPKTDIAFQFHSHYYMEGNEGINPTPYNPELPAESKSKGEKDVS